MPLPFAEVAADPESLASPILDRVNWSSTLWTQFEFLSNAFAIERHPQPGHAAESAFVAERHLLEDLLAEWRRLDRHVEPLRAFLAESLGNGP